MNAISKQPRWTFDENEVLRAHYKQIGLAGVRSMLPHRSPDAIRKQANNLGVTNWELNCEQKRDRGWPLPACDLIESQANIRLRKWRGPVQRGQLMGRIA